MRYRQGRNVNKRLGKKYEQSSIRVKNLRRRKNGEKNEITPEELAVNEEEALKHLQKRLWS